MRTYKIKQSLNVFKDKKYPCIWSKLKFSWSESLDLLISILIILVVCGGFYLYLHQVPENPIPDNQSLPIRRDS